MGGIDEILNSLSEEQRAELAKKLNSKQGAATNRKLPTKNSGSVISGSTLLGRQRVAARMLPYEPPKSNKFTESDEFNQCKVDTKADKKLLNEAKPKKRTEKVSKIEKFLIDCEKCGVEQSVAMRSIIDNHDGTYSYTCRKCTNEQINRRKPV